MSGVPPIRHPPVTVHRIDAEDRLVYMDCGFRQTAMLCGAPELPERVVGQSIFACMEGEDTRFWYDLLIKHVRLWGAASFPFRCDTPTRRRWLTMDMTRLEQESIEFTCRTLLEEAMPHVPFLDPAVPRGHATVVMCGWCKRIRSVMGWLDLPDAANLLEVFNDPFPPRMEYAVCDDDVRRLRSILAP